MKRNRKIMVKIRGDVSEFEHEYLRICEKLICDGELREIRSHKCYTNFFNTIEYSFTHLKFNNVINLPLLTYRKVGVKNIIEEILWIIRGESQAKSLSDRGVHIWDYNTSVEFIKKRNLENVLKEGQLGPMYGWSFRRFGLPWRSDYDSFYAESLENFAFIDQLREVVEKLRKNTLSRNMIMTTFDPLQVNKCILYPCTGIVIQFFVREGKYLDCAMYQRSVDLLIGFPHNFSSYGILMLLVAQLTNLTTGKLYVVMGDTHIYLEHVEHFMTRFENEIILYPAAELALEKQIKEISDVENLTINDFKLTKYESNSPLSFRMF